MNKGGLSRNKAIALIITAVLLIAAFGVVVYLIESRGFLDEQFGDSGDWGSDDGSGEIWLSFDDVDYTCTDDVDAYLIAGTDAGGRDMGEMYRGDLADFIIVLVADNTTEKYAFYQIDRNTMIDMMVPDENGDVEDFAYQQICLAHWYGRDDEERNSFLVSAVTDAMHGLEPTAYYILNMRDIGEVNDAIGGVEVSIEGDMTDLDPAFKDGNTVKLSGKQAELFLRARMDVGEGTNAERMARQTQYMQNAYSMMVGRMRENPEYINDVYDRLIGLMQTDGESNRLSKLTNQLVEYESQGFISFEGETRSGDTQDDGVTHEEFIQDEQSALEAMSRVMDIRIDE